MQTIRFKTNLKCNGCVQAIKPGIESIKEIVSWDVFLDVQDKILEINFKEITEEKLSKRVVDSVTKAGYSITKL